MPFLGNKRIYIGSFSLRIRSLFFLPKTPDVIGIFIFLDKKRKRKNLKKRTWGKVKNLV